MLESPFHLCSRITSLLSTNDYWWYVATSCEELTHWKRLWCWEGLGAGGEGDDRGCDGWMASLTRWTWVWVNSGNWWWTGRPGVLRFMGSKRIGHDWATELNWTQLNDCCVSFFSFLVLVLIVIFQLLLYGGMDRGSKICLTCSLWTSLVVYENIKKQTLPDGEKCHTETLTFQVEKGYNFSLPS